MYHRFTQHIEDNIMIYLIVLFIGFCYCAPSALICCLKTQIELQVNSIFQKYLEEHHLRERRWEFHLYINVHSSSFLCTDFQLWVISRCFG